MREVVSHQCLGERWSCLGDWARTAKGDGSFDADDLRTLRDETGAEYLIAGSLGPIAQEPEFAAGPYRVYRLAR